MTVPLVQGEMPHDYAATTFPDYPLLPLFESIDCMPAESPKHDLQWTSVDIITDRNNLLKLAGWADPGCDTQRSTGDFRIDIQLVGPWTVLFQRWSEQLMHSGGGYSETFEAASCRPGPGCDVPIQPGAKRVISYVSTSRLRRKFVFL